MSPYTVLLLYPDYLSGDGGETYLAHVMAETPRLAVCDAQAEAATQNGFYDEDANGDSTDFVPLIVFPGHLEPCAVSDD